MFKPHETGSEGEKEAAAYLEQKGFKILERNWRSGHLELDIVAMDANILVVVEVKTRSTNEFGEPETFVTASKQQKLIRAANLFVEKKNLDCEIRFDVVSIIRPGTGAVVHIPDAFGPRVG